jgi:transcriptional regulator of aromatic amino acid metabolism
MQEDDRINPQFDALVEALEAIVLNEHFKTTVETFARANCGVFSNDSENKLEYMQLFQAYQQITEQHIDEELRHRIPEYTPEMLEELLVC